MLATNEDLGSVPLAPGGFSSREGAKPPKGSLLCGFAPWREDLGHDRAKITMGAFKWGLPPR